MSHVLYKAKRLYMNSSALLLTDHALDLSSKGINSSFNHSKGFLDFCRRAAGFAPLTFLVSHSFGQQSCRDPPCAGTVWQRGHSGAAMVCGSGWAHTARFTLASLILGPWRHLGFQRLVFLSTRTHFFLAGVWLFSSLYLPSFRWRGARCVEITLSP